ncbi:MAG: PilZ domain-containing protein, partial [Polyangiaceae bacterium]
GEVVWRQEEGDGGEFGVRFTDLDEESVGALSKLALTPIPQERKVEASGTKVRLHIEGLGSPMRARVKGASKTELTVGSELGFLRVGSELELEDAASGAKRPARIDRVDVEIDPETKIPQLVVSLKYEDATARAVDVDLDRDTELDAVDEGDLESIESASEKMKSAFARKAAAVTPALLDAFKKYKAAAIALAEKKMKKMKKDEASPKRMTAPPPGGALHATGRKVIRDEALADTSEKGLPALLAKAEVHKKKLMIGSAIAALLLLFVLATHKHEAAATPDKNALAANAQAPAVSSAAPAQDQAQGGPLAADSSMANAANPMTQGQAMGAAPIVMPPGQIQASDTSSSSYDTTEPIDEPAPRKPIRVIPFASGGAIGHGNVLRLKMDGAIEKIEGASDSTGFSVVIPNRRSLEAAAPLAARDGRIASIKVENGASGADLSVQFKDGVPRYEVRARGDQLEIVLAPSGGIAKHDKTPPATANREAPKKASTHHRSKR